MSWLEKCFCIGGILEISFRIHQINKIVFRVAFIRKSTGHLMLFYKVTLGTFGSHHSITWISEQCPRVSLHYKPFKVCFSINLVSFTFLIFKVHGMFFIPGPLRTIIPSIILKNFLRYIFKVLLTLSLYVTQHMFPFWRFLHRSMIEVTVLFFQ